MRAFRKPAALFLFCTVLAISSVAWSAGLTKDGQAVVTLAGDEYNRISEQNPVVSHRELDSYLEKVAGNLLPAGTQLPRGVSLSVTILDKQLPEIYSLANGVLVITTGALLTLENEAQLAALFSHEVAHLTGSHYPGIYQAFKEGEKKARGKSLVSGLAGVVVGAAVDYTVMSKTQDVYADLDSGDVSYRAAMKEVLAIEAGAGVVDGFSDVYQGLPP